jgi:bifunctional enzyme CysN/CysC/sulfate adenylyltransferase subunit 1
MAVVRSDTREPVPPQIESHFHKDLLRFTTAGSVDDGKSTLIGRLLHDSKSIYEDQLASVQKSRVNRSGGPIDFALLTDGLRAEREQGITIDVAYRYFETPVRKFIIADTPGHEQYTRNMATGASTADLAIILVDASRGLLPQTRRHAYISSLLGIENVVAAINKMDLVDYREDIFLQLQHEFLQLARQLRLRHVVGIPISALAGDNVVNHTAKMPWYKGPMLLSHLEQVPLRLYDSEESTRFPVQYVLRPDGSFRGFAGRVASGSIRPGDSVLALPSKQTTRVRSIVTRDGDLKESFAPMSVTVTLDDEIDLSRGDMLVSPKDPPIVSRNFETMIVWFDAQPMAVGRNYLVKHNVRMTRAKPTRIRFRVNMQTLDQEPARELKMNDVACVEFEAASPLYFDPYERNRITGSFILIDPLSNATVGAAMIQRDLATNVKELETEELWKTPVTPELRYERHGHDPAVIIIEGRPTLASYLENALFAQGYEALLVSSDEIPVDHLEATVRFSWSVGLVLIVSGAIGQAAKLRWKAHADHRFFDLTELALPPDDEKAIPAVLASLKSLRGVQGGAGKPGSDSGEVSR